MSKKLIEIRLESLSGAADELHFHTGQMTKIVNFPFKMTLLETSSDSPKIDIELYNLNKQLLKGSFLLSTPTTTFHSSDRAISLTLIQTLVNPFSSKIIPIVPVKPFQSCPGESKLNLYFDEKFSDVNSYVKFLEFTITGVEKKLEATQVIKSQESELGKIFQFASVIPENSKKGYQECIEKYLKIISEKDKTIWSCMKEKEEIGKRLEKELGILSEKKKSEERLMGEVNALKNELVKLKAENRNYGSMKKCIDELEKMNSFKETSLNSLRDLVKTQENAFKELADLMEKNNSEIIIENNSLTETVNALKSQNKVLKAQVEIANSEKNTENSLMLGENLMRNVMEKESNYSKTESKIELINALHKEISELKQRNTDIVQASKKVKEECGKICKVHLSEIDGLKKKIHFFENSLKNSKNPPESPVKLQIFQQNLQISNESDKLLSQLQSVQLKSIYENSTLYTDSERLSKTLIKISHELLVYQEIIVKVVEAFRESKAENMALREKLYLIQMHLPLYIPVKGDPIDFAMAEYVNSLRNPLKIPFVREEHGIYLFGSRNVQAKLQIGKLCIAFYERIMPIEEFVANFTKPELEKFEQQRKINEIASQKILAKSSSLAESTKTPIPVLQKKNMSSYRSANSSFDLLQTTNASFISNVSQEKIAKTPLNAKKLLFPIKKK